MDEIELRLAALELAFVEVHAWTDPQAIADAIASIRDGLGRGDADEDAIRAGAVDHLEAARDRFRGPAIGAALTRDD